MSTGCLGSRHFFFHRFLIKLDQSSLSKYYRSNCWFAESSNFLSPLLIEVLARNGINIAILIAKEVFCISCLFFFNGSMDLSIESSRLKIDSYLWKELWEEKCGRLVRTHRIYEEKEQNMGDGKNNRIEGKHREKLDFAGPIFNSILKTIGNLI